MTLVSSAQLLGYQAQRATRGVAITYSRGATSLAITAVVGRSGANNADFGDLFAQGVEARDYLVLATDLTLGEPAIRDTITEGARTYRVAEQGGEPVWDYSDPDRQIIRVHTTRVV
jgi:hypothetical protein